MWIKRWQLALTKIWTILVGFMLGFQNISDFSESFSHKRNSQKNELEMCQGAAPAGRNVYRNAAPARSKPQRGEMFIASKQFKIVQSLVH